MTPAEEMRDAARILREVAGNAAPGPWSVGGDEFELEDNLAWLEPEGDGKSCGRCTSGTIDLRNARWIALLSPAIAEPLATWLDSSADDAEEIGPDHRALTMARQIRSQWQAMQETGRG